LNAFQNLIKKIKSKHFLKMLQKEKQKINWERKREKENREKEKRKKNEKKIVDQVGANGLAHTARRGVRRGASTNLVGA
jgi:hypothetical protein